MIIKAGDQLIPEERIRRIDISDVLNERVVIHTDDGEFEASGFDAIEAVMALKPSALEGRRLKWHKHAWAFHNIIGHPVMQLLAWLRLYRLAMKVHDATTPRPR